MGNEFSKFKEELARKGIVLAGKEAQIMPNDSGITGGRRIVNVKSNQLFTGQFEEIDINNFIAIWRQYRTSNKCNLRSLLLKACKSVNINYRKEVCPIEVMLYTSNIISSSFGSNISLIDEVADVVFQIWKETNSYISSIEHIARVWKWPHIINICAVAAGKIGDSELLRYIYDNYSYDDNIRLCCFIGLLQSKKTEFVPEILQMVSILEGGSDIDRRIGNKFRNEFATNYPDYYGQLSSAMFEKSSSYVKGLVSKMIDEGEKDKTYQGRYSNAKSMMDKKAIMEEGFNKMFNSPEQPGLYDIVNMFKAAHNNEMSERLYEKLDLDHTQGIRKSVVVATVSYFNTVYHEKALKKIENVSKDNTYYAAARLALFHQGKITGDELMKSYLSETRSDQLKTYLSGFYGMAQKGNEIQESAFRYLSKNLNADQLSVAISNYEKLIRKYRHLYDKKILSLMSEWFGYNTVFRTCKLSLADQTSCLNIIEAVIDKNNCRKYQDFLYYVAEQGPAFNYVVSSKAGNILIENDIWPIK